MRGISLLPPQSLFKMNCAALSSRKIASPTVRLIAGIDVGYLDNGHTARAAVVLLNYPGLELVEFATARSPVRFPYAPGLLSFAKSR